MTEEIDGMREHVRAHPVPRPLEVTVVGVMLVIAAAVSIATIFMTYSMPLARYAVEQSYQSFTTFVFFSLAAAGLALPTGVGMLTRRTWGRLMYLVAAPIYLTVLVAMNGFHQSMALGILSYPIFAVLLNSRESVDYFSLWGKHWGRR